jgi:glycosylphosphatidylinositol transamidase (GPIT) subunit GPI8
MKVLALAFFFVLAVNVNAAHWAVLVAGSNGFWNYRH